MKPDYYFASTGGGTVGGFNNPLAANFAYEGDLTGILVREAIQNIVDAKLPGEATVRAEFDLELVQADKLPQYEHLGEIFSKCADFADNKNIIYASKHYRTQAKTITENNIIPLLKISDFNTCGLEGDHENGRWFNLMRGVGINSGAAAEGGAFGLGKGAFFANSQYKTIFVTSVTGEGVKFAGKSMLTSFEKDGDIMQENGTFGLEGQLPVTNRSDIPDIFNKRTQKGTDIWIVNYTNSESWKENIFRAVLGWFWPAIHWGMLTVRIGDKDINKANLRERMMEYYSVDDNIAQKPFNPLHFFDAYVDSEITPIKRELDNLKDVYFYGRTSDQLPLSNKTALIRNTGMVIDFIAKISPVTKYVAVIECKNDIGSPILRKMENPSHTEWKPNNWKDEYGNIVEIGRAAMKEIKFILDVGLSKLLFTPGEMATVIPGLTDYIGTPSTDNISTDPGIANNLVIEPVDEETGMEIGAETEKTQANQIRTIQPVRVGTPVQGGGGGGIPHPHEPNPHIPPIQPREEAPEGGKTYVELKDAVIRYVVGAQTSSGRLYNFIFHSDSVTEKVAVRLRLYSRSEEGEGSILEIQNALPLQGTGIIKTSNEYCDFYLNEEGKANLSIELKEPWTVAIDPTLKIKI